MNNKPVLKNEIFYIKMLGINIRCGASPPSEPLPEQAVTDGALRRISVENFQILWSTEKKHLPLTKNTVSIIEKHFSNITLVQEL
ncbi:MAG: hypothetical protein ACKOAD_00070 [Gammaproteobacteria bacterium]